MKKLFFILSLLFIVTSCDDDQTAAPEPQPIITAQDSIKSYEGNFISAGDAAVLKGSRFIFQVKMDSTAKTLQEDLKSFEDRNGGVIPVTVKGKVIENPSPTGYSQQIEIKEVLEISGEKQVDTEDKN